MPEDVVWLPDWQTEGVIQDKVAPHSFRVASPDGSEIVKALESYPACIACKSNKELTDKLGAVPNVTQHNAYRNAHS